MSDRPIVSVLMPCFNAGDTLETSVRSILNQTLEELELVAVDDGSTDSTLDLLRSLAQEDRRLRPLMIKHAGIIEALNHGLAACRAPYIARMDADDYCAPERLARQVELLESDQEIAVVGCLVEGIPKDDVRQGFEIYLDWLNSLVTPEAIAREIFVESPLAHPSVVVRREWYERLGGYKELGWPEDYDLWLRMHLAGARFAKVDEILLGWRERAQRLTRTDSRYSVENFLRAKAHYLLQGPLKARDSVILWGAGQMGRRISKYLLRGQAPLVGFIDVDPAKIGKTVRNLPVRGVDELAPWLASLPAPVILAAVGARGARALIRKQLTDMDLDEGLDWWAIA